MCGDSDFTSSIPALRNYSSYPFMKIIFIILGWFFVLLGVIGIFLPVMPTTIFMILALAAFAESSPRFHDWLYHHALFGPPLQQWKKYRVIPPVAKIMSVTMMTGSLLYVSLFTAIPNYIDLIIGIGFALIAWFILSKPSYPPER